MTFDRVWNKDVAYGANTLNHKRALAIGMSASDAAQYAKRGYDKAMETEIVTGIFEFCGISDGRLEFLHGSTVGGERAEEMIAEAKGLGRSFADGL